MNPTDFFTCPGTEFLIEKAHEEPVGDSLTRCQLIVDHLKSQAPPAAPPPPAPPDTGLDWLPTSWIDWLWSLWWTGTHITVTLAIVAIGIIVTGAAVAATPAKDDQKVGAFAGVLVGTVVVGVFWPLLSIIAPFAILAGCLYWTGVHVCHKLGLADEQRTG